MAMSGSATLLADADANARRAASEFRVTSNCNTTTRERVTTSCFNSFSVVLGSNHTRINGGLPSTDTVQGNCRVLLYMVRHISSGEKTENFLGLHFEGGPTNNQCSLSHTLPASQKHVNFHVVRDHAGFKKRHNNRTSGMRFV